MAMAVVTAEREGVLSYTSTIAVFLVPRTLDNKISPGHLPVRHLGKLYFPESLPESEGDMAATTDTNAFITTTTM